MPSNLDALIPHRAPMQWIDALTDCTETAATGTVCFKAGHFAVADGAVMESALIECVAQTVAAAQGRRAQSRGNSEGPKAGVLASVADFQILCPPPMGEVLQIEVRELKRFGPMLLVSGVVSSEGRLIASGELTLYA
jgi:3-hydroxyacyl-[acyl-carrier-protein] dehydratase